MWTHNKVVKEKKEAVTGNQLVGIAIDKDKGSQVALKWATENLLLKGQTAILIHVKLRPSSHSGSFLTSPKVMSTTDNGNGNSNVSVSKEIDPSTRELFLPFRCFCTRKDVSCRDIVIEDVDVGKALIEYVSQAGIDNLVVGATTRSGFLRFKTIDIPGSVIKGAPDFCNVYVISRGKIQNMRTASRPAPASSPLRSLLLSQSGVGSHSAESQFPQIENMRPEKPPLEAARRSQDNTEFRSPFTRKGYHGKMPGEISLPDTDISFVSSGRLSVDRLFPTFFDTPDSGRTPPRLSSGNDSDIYVSFESQQFGRKSLDVNYPPEFSSMLSEDDRLSTSSQSMEEVEAEMRRLKLELKQTMEMYSTACKEAITAKQKAIELQRWKSEEEQRLEEARHAEEAALAMVEQEKAKSRAAMEAAEASKRIAELEARKRINAEIKAFKEADEKKKALDALANQDVRYRKYSIEEIEAATELFSESLKIGEGGYGPVYKGYLDHTPVAIKVLRPDAAQGRSQFQKEVEVLSCIRHPNMVLLLGACPEYGCLVYEFMGHGSLDDCLFRRGDNSRPLSWQRRFKIAAEIGTALLFLHQTKPEPLVHRDLKPANILLDNNYVSKISDVGLARLVPPSIADSVTQYRMTSTAGTFCYIDPEYQQTGMLGVKSDVYSLGIMFLQLITAKPPMGLTHHVERAIEKGTLSEILDPSVTDWPAEETSSFAELALKCAELRRKDRPDLCKVVLPKLIKLQSLAEASMYSSTRDGVSSPVYSRSQATTRRAS